YGGTIILYEGGKAVGSGRLTADGGWTVGGVKLTSGYHTLTAVQTDSNNETSSPSESLTILVDSNAPAAPYIWAVNGISSAVSVSNGVGLSVEGGGTAGAMVQLFNDVNKNDKIDSGELLAASSVGDDGVWSASIDLSGGVHSTIKAIQTNVAGNSSMASKAAPTITVNTPGGLSLDAADDTGIKGDFITSKQSGLTISGTATTARVILFVNGDMFSEAPVTKGRWQTDLFLEGGAYSIAAAGADANGEQTSDTSIPFTLVVDTTPPESPYLATVGGYDAYEGALLENAKNVLFTGGGEPGATVELLKGSTSLGTGSVDYEGRWTVTVPKLSSGNNFITARQTDLAGNVGMFSVGLYVSVSGPARPTGLDLLATDDTGTYNDDNVTSKTALTITGTGAEGATVTLLDGSKSVGTAVVKSDGIWSVPTKGLTDGVHDFTATQKVAGEDASGASDPLSVTVVTKLAAPVVYNLFTSQTEGLTVSGTGVAGNIVTLSVNGKGQGEAVGVNEDGTWIAPVYTFLTSGTHSITATQTNPLVGLTSVSSNKASLVIDNVPPAAPTKLDLAAASDSGKSNSDNLTAAGKSLTITGTGEKGATVRLFDVNNGQLATSGGLVNDKGVWTAVILEGLPAFDFITSYAIQAQQTDAAGNVGPLSTALSINVYEAFTPEAPAVTGLLAADDTGFPGDYITNKTSFTVTGLGYSGADVVLYEGSKSIATATATGDGNWSAKVSGLSQGYHALTARQSISGEFSEASPELIVSIDTTAPAAVTGMKYTDGLIMGGNGESGAAITLFNDSNKNDRADEGEVVAAVPIYESGSWATEIGGLADGRYSFKAIQSDTAGNVSKVSAPVTVRIGDSSSTPTGLALLTSDDSGVSGDGITNKSTLTVTGGGEPGAKVALFDGSSSKGTATISAAGDWSVKLSGLSQGSHILTAKQLVDGEWSEASPELNVSIDTTAPAAITGMKYADGLISGKGEAGAVLTLFNDSNKNDRADDGEVVGESFTVDETGNWSSGVTLDDGRYSFKAIQSDWAGNVSKVSALTFRIGGSISTPTGLALLTSDDSGVPGDGITNKSSLTVTGGGEPGVKVALFDGSSSKGTATISAAGDWSVKLSGLSQGNHVLTAKQLVDGEWSEASPELSVSIDTTAPAAVTGMKYKEGLISGSGEKGASLTLFNDSNKNDRADEGEVVGESFTVDETGNWSSSVTLELGKYSFKALQSDLAGNVSKISAALPVTVRDGTITPPTGLALLSIDDSGAASDGITNKSTVSVIGNGESGSKVVLFEGSTAKGTATVTPANNWSIKVAGLSQGAHTLTAQQLLDGLESNLSDPFEVIIDTSAPSTPTGLDLAASSDGGPSDSDNITSVTENLAFSGRGEAGNSVILFVDKNKNSKFDSGEIRASEAITIDGEGNWSGILATLTAGSHAVVASQSDLAGNVSKGSVAVNVVVDTDAPAAPTKLDLAAADDSGSNKSDNITARASDLTISGSGEKGLRLYLFDGDTTDIGSALATTTVSSSGQWSIDIAALTVDKHAIRAVQSDLAGNLSPASTALELEIIVSEPPKPPTALALLAGDDSGVSNSDGITNKNKGLTITGDSVASAQIKLFAAGSVVGTTAANAAGKWSVKLASLDSGAHAFTAQQTTDTGTSADSDPLAVTIDTSSPAAPSELQVDGSQLPIYTSADGAGLTITGFGEEGAQLLLFDDISKDGKINSGELLKTISVVGTAWETTIDLFGGSHTIKAIQTNAAGTASKASAALAIVVSTPGGFDLASDDDIGLSNTDNITSKGSGLTLSGSATNGAKFVSLYVDGIFFATAAVTKNSWKTDLSLSGGSTYTITASQTDSNGTESLQSIPFSLVVDEDDPEAPTEMTIADQPVAEQHISNKNSNLVIAGHGESGARVTLLEGKTSLGTADVDGDGHWRLVLAKISDGSHILTAKQTDVAGNISALSEQPLRISIDGKVPAAPSGLKFSSSTNIVSGSGEAEASLTLFEDVNNDEKFDPESVDILVDSDKVTTKGTWSIDVSSLPTGKHTNIRAVQTDAAGNVSKASSALSVTIAAASLSRAVQSYMHPSPIDLFTPHPPT
ncbi:MAG: hypothetical protein HQL60_06160, partial [Magnetococcales bacterium]|nr:hypothetical protein [Magnetococcales bacterium]